MPKPATTYYHAVRADFFSGLPGGFDTRRDEREAEDRLGEIADQPDDEHELERVAEFHGVLGEDELVGDFERDAADDAVDRGADQDSDDDEHVNTSDVSAGRRGDAECSGV